MDRRDPLRTVIDVGAGNAILAADTGAIHFSTEFVRAITGYCEVRGRAILAKITIELLCARGIRQLHTRGTVRGITLRPEGSAQGEREQYQQ